MPPEAKEVRQKFGPVDLETIVKRRLINYRNRSHNPFLILYEKMTAAFKRNMKSINEKKRLWKEENSFKSS